MAFSVNHDEAGSFELIPEGDYECIIEDARATATKLGTPYIGIKLKIRTDVAKNPLRQGTIHHSMWMKKEPTENDLACEGFSAKQVQMLSKAAGLQNGKSYASIMAWCDDLIGRPVCATVEHDTWKDKTNARVKWFNETRYPHIQGAQEFTEIKDDEYDVPF